MEKYPLQAVKDYKICARYFDFKYVDKEPEELYYRKLIKNRYKICLTKVVYFFFYKKMGGQIPSFNALINRWEKIWFKDSDLFDIDAEIVDPRQEGLISLNTDATSVLLRFYEKWERDEGLPLSIASDVITPINNDLAITDTIDLSVRYRGRKGNDYQNIKFYVGLQKPNTAHYLLDFANMKSTFEYRNEEKLNPHDTVSYYLYDLGSERRSDNMIQMHVQPEDVEDLFYWANQISQDKVCPSRRGLTVLCKGCPFDEQCAKWDDWDGSRRIRV